MRVDPKSMVRRLTPTATRRLEAAVGRAVGSQHEGVCAEHLLSVVLEPHDGEAATLMQHAGRDRDRLRERVERHLTCLARSAGGRPVLTESLLRWMEEAWLLASLEWGETRLRTGALLVQWMRTPSRYCAERLVELEDLPVDSLVRDGPSVLAATREAPECVSEGASAAPLDAASGVGEDGPLRRFCVNFTERARQGEIDPVLGRDAEVRRIVDVLARRKKNNPLLVGEPGVGKTALVEGLALAIARREVPDVLRDVEVAGLDLGSLQAGASMRGEFENRLKSVIRGVQAAPKKTLLFIDEAHTLVGTGAPPGGPDAANLLKPALSRGELRTIAATTWGEYKKYLERDAALERRFELIKVEEPGEEDAIRMLRGVVPVYERAHGIRIRDEAVVAAVKLAQRYVPARQLPDKSVDLLDTTAARVHVDRSIESKCSGRTGEPSGTAVVDVDAIARTVAAWTGIPAGRMKRDTAAAALSLEQRLRERIFGQDTAVRTVAETLRAAHAGIAPPEQPMGVLLLIGPSGVGKTETARALADELFGGERFVTRIHLTEFQEKCSVSRLIGAAPGYVGYGEGGVLTEAVRQRPYQVVLLDECEKAHPEVMNLFYQVFDKGQLSDGEGRTVHFHNTVIILTSNLCSDELLQLYQNGLSPDHDTIVQTVRPGLRRHFQAALLNRMTIVPFAPLGREQLRSIAWAELDSLRTRIAGAHGVRMEIDDAVVDELVRRCRYADGGARDLGQIIRKTVMSAVARELLERTAAQQALERVAIGMGEDGAVRVASRD